MIAHNVLFDKNVLLSELYRYKLNKVINKILSMSVFCTSKGCANITRIKYRANIFKHPKLCELYEFLFKKEIVPAHDALVDTEVLAECFLELLKRDLISIKLSSN